MTLSFSERHGYKVVKEIQLESIDNDLRVRISNFVVGIIKESFKKNAVLEFIGTEILLMHKNNALYTYEEKIFEMLNEGQWHEVYSFIEKIFPLLVQIRIENYENGNELYKELNAILVKEKSAYRFLNDILIPITNDLEVETIEIASNTKYSSVNIHIQKALKLYANRERPDYENSIKESISAVEAISCIIVENDKATLSSALDRLGGKGVVMHRAQIDAFKKLYGYTSDENGIRHAGIEFSNASPEDARFMLIACSSFCNYLIEKYEG